jgi:hypothetical protein
MSTVLYGCLETKQHRLKQEFHAQDSGGWQKPESCRSGEALNPHG